MAFITLAALGATAATAAVAWTVPKILNKLEEWSSGKGKGQSRPSSRRGPRTSQRGGVKSIELPGGDVLHQIEKHNPGITAAIKKNQKQLFEYMSKNPEKWPGAQQFMAQAQGFFGDQTPYQRTDIPQAPGEADWQSPDFGGMTAEAMQRFKGEVVPGLAERFTSLTGGGQRSGAFARQTTRAGERLTSALHAQQGKMAREDQMARADYAMRRGQLQMQGAQLGIQQEGEAWRQGLAQQDQRMKQAGFMADIYGKGREAEESWVDRQIRMLQSDVPTTYDTVTQPKPEQQPGFWSGLAKSGGEAVGKYAPYAIDAGLKYYGYSGVPGLGS